MREARDDPGEPRSGTVESGPSWRSFRARSVQEEPGWASWSWPGGGPKISIVGAFLVLLGVALIVQYLAPQVSLTSLFLLAIGLGFGAAWLVARARSMFVPAAVFIALALARLGGELGYLAGTGWPPTLLGAAFLLAWLVGRLQGASRTWALWVGALLLLIGLAQLSNRIPGLPDLGLVWPLLIIVVGGALLLRTRSRAAPPP